MRGVSTSSLSPVVAEISVAVTFGPCTVMVQCFKLPHVPVNSSVSGDAVRVTLNVMVSLRMALNARSGMV